MAGAELAKPAGKIDDIAENQEQNTDKPDSQTRIKSKEDMANAKARLAEIENQQKDLSNNKNIEDNDKQEQSSKLQKEKESITNKIKDKEKINSHNLRYGITSSISHTNIYFSLLQIYLNTAEQWQQNILVQKKTWLSKLKMLCIQL